MKDMIPFDIFSHTLEGTSLIEASAGTGKTYTITGLFVRLILEKKLSVDQILVVTFTEAATAELKDRIRSRLKEAAEAFAAGSGGDDPFLEDLLANCSDHEAAEADLWSAVRSFDEAAVFTIHGFCQRMLIEKAFESRSGFDSEFVENQDAIIREIVDGFWRRNFSKASGFFIDYLVNKKITADDLFLFARQNLTPGLRIIPETEVPGSAEPESAFSDALGTARDMWATDGEAVKKILLKDTALNRKQYALKSLGGWIEKMDEAMTSGGMSAVLFDKLEKFTQSCINGACKKNTTPPDHPFFSICDDLLAAGKRLEDTYGAAVVAFRRRLLYESRAELEKYKDEKNLLSFDDLLINLHRAVTDPSNAMMAKEIREAYKAALIDEFQDTDPLQYEIFDTIFNAGNSTLFLIGDPKQAIYGFRGADIFAYIRASQKAERRFTLEKNWRSQNDLVTAVNTLFENAGSAFVYDEIPFYPASAADTGDRDRLVVDGKSQVPFHIRYLHSAGLAEPDKMIGKGRAVQVIAQAVAGEISSLLNLAGEGRAVLGQSPLKEGDVAVLVRKNAEAAVMKDALSHLGIPAVICDTGNVFESAEAAEMERILLAVETPHRETLVKSALAGDFFGMTGEDIDSLRDDGGAWDEWLETFGKWHDTWRRKGFMRMMGTLLAGKGVAGRLMALDGGERRVTNLLHLVELVHRESVLSHAGMERLVKWLAERIDGGLSVEEENQLRMESDENAVKIVTMHKSKGLEYPVVFCPFTWGDSEIKGPGNGFTFHDEENRLALTLDLGSEDSETHKAAARKEILAENLRLLYVALTRARNQCFMVWGRINKSETSAPAYIFHPERDADGEHSPESASMRFKKMSDDEVLADLYRIGERSGGSIEVGILETGEGKPLKLSGFEKDRISFSPFRGRVGSDFGISSFSSLTSKAPHSAETADYNDSFEPEDADAVTGGGEEKTIFTFPKGAKPGTFMHDIFEHFDFACAEDAVLRGLVERKLVQYGYDISWTDAVADMVKKVVSLPLDSGDSTFTLSSVTAENRLNELEFYFPMANMAAEMLRGVYGGCETLPESMRDQMKALDFSVSGGFMKGFVDLVFRHNDKFYIIDWKSNFLGGTPESYTPERLESAMSRSYYHLQYHIYLTALDRYLNKRLPDYSYDRHIGGVFYIFLRGVDPDRGSEYGVYTSRPSADLVRRMGALFSGAGK